MTFALSDESKVCYNHTLFSLASLEKILQSSRVFEVENQLEQRHFHGFMILTSFLHRKE